MKLKIFPRRYSSGRESDARMVMFYVITKTQPTQQHNTQKKRKKDLQNVDTKCTQMMKLREWRTGDEMAGPKFAESTTMDPMGS